MKATMKIASHISTLGAARGVARSRIWLEGARLMQAGFAASRPFYAVWASHSLTLTAEKPGAEVFETRTVSGGKDRPIIDITGRKVFDAFGKDHTHVSVRYAPGKITMHAHAYSKIVD